MYIAIKNNKVKKKPKKVKTIPIAKNIRTITPAVLKKLPADADYTLTKVFAKNGVATGVYPGEGTTGTLSIIEVKMSRDEPKGRPGLVITGGIMHYVRTSPILDILDVTDNVITIETNGGIYKLEKHEKQKQEK